MKRIGIVDQLWRYPIKSVLGHTCDEIQVSARGFLNDRIYALRDKEEKLGSGKNSSRFVNIKGLLNIETFYKNKLLKIKLPDQKVWDCDDYDIDQHLSKALDMNVTLEEQSSQSFFDDSPIHIISTGSLHALKGLLPDSNIDERRFRANIIIDTNEKEPIEHNWIGKKIQLGDVHLEITKPTQRCVMTTAQQKDIPKDPAILKAISKKFNTNFGVYAKVLKEGDIFKNDLVYTDLTK